MSTQTISSPISYQQQQPVPEFTAETKTTLTQLFTNTEFAELVGKCSTLVDKADKLEKVSAQFARAEKEEKAGYPERKKGIALYIVAGSVYGAYIAVMCMMFPEITALQAFSSVMFPTIGIFLPTTAVITNTYFNPSAACLMKICDRLRKEVLERKQELASDGSVEMKHLYTALNKKYVEVQEKVNAIPEDAENTPCSKQLRNQASLEKAQDQLNNLWFWISGESLKA